MTQYGPGLDKTEINIKAKFHEDCIKTVPSEDFLRFDLVTYFFIQWDIVSYLTDFNKDKHSDSVSWRLDQNCAF